MVELFDNGNFIGFCGKGSRGERSGQTEHQQKAEEKGSDFFHSRIPPNLIMIVCSFYLFQGRHRFVKSTIVITS